MSPRKILNSPQQSINENKLYKIQEEGDENYEASLTK